MERSIYHSTYWAESFGGNFVTEDTTLSEGPSYITFLSWAVK